MNSAPITDVPSNADLAAMLGLLLERTAAGERRFFSVADAAVYASLSEESIRRLLSAGKLTALRPVKGKISIDRQELDAFILSSTARPRIGRGLSKSTGNHQP